MSDVARALARHRVTRARECLRDGHVLMSAGGLGGAVNRFYYAAFHAARAVLATRGLDSSRHSGVIALFQQHFVKPGLVASEIARALPRAFEKRMNSDYEDFAALSVDEARRVEAETDAFVTACVEFLGRELSGFGDDDSGQT